MDPIEVDARLVRQALINLLLNSVQAMPKGGSIILSTRVERRGERLFACVDVTDTGSGIALEDQKRILEPFFTTKATGTGLGLPLVKRVVEAHQGELALTSSTMGSTFTMRLPMTALAQMLDSGVRLRRDASDEHVMRGGGAAGPSQGAGTG
jgi:signal transduction histidine kinase